MPLRPCLGIEGEPPCPRLVAEGRCPRHERAQNAKKNSQPHRWVYRDGRWRNYTRPTALARAGYRCEEILDGGERCSHTDYTGRTLHVDHDPIGVRELLARLLNPFDVARVKVRCESCHGRKTQREQQLA